MVTRPRDSLGYAVGAILIAVLSLSFGDAVIKLISANFSIWQIYIVRSTLALFVLFVLLKLTEPDVKLLPVAIFWTSLRSLLLGFMWVAYYVSLPHIKLSVAAAVYYTSPLFIALLSSLFTEDKAGSRLWLAMTVGFAGVLIIVRPDANGYNAYVLLPLIAAILYAFAMLITRTRSRHENPKVLSFALNVMFVVIGLIAMLFFRFWPPSSHQLELNPFWFSGWSHLEFSDWVAMSVLALVMVVGSWFAAIAYQRGVPSIIAIFDYSYLIFSALWGLLIFAEAPDFFTVGGMFLIAVAGFISLR